MAAKRKSSRALTWLCPLWHLRRPAPRLAALGCLSAVPPAVHMHRELPDVCSRTDFAAHTRLLQVGEGGQSFLLKWEGVPEAAHRQWRELVSFQPVPLPMHEPRPHDCAC
jgi:hypothetical protein